MASGRDIYAFTAPLVVEAMERVLRGEVKTAGVFTAGQAFDARDFLAALCPKHLLLDNSREDTAFWHCGICIQLQDHPIKGGLPEAGEAEK